MTPGTRKFETAAKTGTWRVGVTGFLDWPETREEAAGFDHWRCVTNPSGLLFTGDSHPGIVPPEPGRGPLPRLLSSISRTSDHRDVEWHFQLLPVLWGIANQIDTEAIDAVVSLGLGVYDADDRLRVEQGAFNRRARQCDAAGVVPTEEYGPSEVIDPRYGRIIEEPSGSRVSIAALSSELDTTGYRVEQVSARETNAFVCNETYALLLGQLGGGGRLAKAAFIHVPRTDDDPGLDRLAEAVTRIIRHVALP